MYRKRNTYVYTHRSNNMGDLKKNNKYQYISQLDKEDHRTRKKEKLIIDYFITIKNNDVAVETKQKFSEEDVIDRLRGYLELFYKNQIEKEEGKKMARYRTYKNGITGHRYKGYYIIKGEEKGLFQIWREDKTIYQDKIYDYDECEWIIDKVTVSDEEMLTIKQLYAMEIYQLSSLLVDLMQKKEREGDLDSKSKALYKWVEKVRKRKAEDRQF